jgi:hypothetical protein
MKVVFFFVLVALFTVLTPGILVSLPPKGSKLTVAITHGFVFAIVFSLFYYTLMSLSHKIGQFTGLEGMHNPSQKNKKPKTATPSIPVPKMS